MGNSIIGNKVSVFENSNHEPNQLIGVFQIIGISNGSFIVMDELGCCSLKTIEYCRVHLETETPVALPKQSPVFKATSDQEVIREMKKMRKKGGTFKEIAKHLNESETPTFSGNGKWHAQTIHRLCTTPKTKRAA